MSRLSKSLLLASFYLGLSFLFSDFHQLSAYVSVPRNPADTTDRMNAAGDPPDRPGLRDTQRMPEHLDDVWGRNDYYYSHHGIRDVGNIHHPEYDLHRPPYPPLPNTYYDRSSTDFYNYDMRYYRPAYSR